MAQPLLALLALKVDCTATLEVLDPALLRIRPCLARRPGGIWHVGMNMFVLWMFGRDDRAATGPLEFLYFYLIAIVFSGLVWLGLGMPGICGSATRQPGGFLTWSGHPEA